MSDTTSLPGSAPCLECGHVHQGAALAYICIGCPCQESPGRMPAEPLLDAPQVQMVGRVPGSAVVLTMRDGSHWHLDPDEAETVAERMLNEVQEIRENDQ